MNRTFVAVLLGISGLAGLFMTACGGFFTVAGLGSLRDPYSGGILMLAVPSLLAGLGVIWLVGRRYKSWRAVGDTISQIESTHAPGPPPDSP
jgi:hypothetical protein